MTRILSLAGAALGGALIVALGLALTGGGTPAPAVAAPPLFTAADGSFRIAAPDGWKAVADGEAATVLQREDERGVVVIRERPALAGSLDELSGRLGRTLERRLADFQPAGARRIDVGGAEGLVYTFARAEAGQVQSIVVRPAGNRSYTLDLVADGDAPDVARELAVMVRSFAPVAG